MTDPKSATLSPVQTLYIYFTWSQEMMRLLDSTFAPHIQAVVNPQEPIRDGEILADRALARLSYIEKLRGIAYMNYWLAGLYVVVEGWYRLKLQDDRINSILSPKHIRMLRNYRHNIFHFDQTITTTLEFDAEASDWGRALVVEFERYFRECGIDKSAVE